MVSSTTKMAPDSVTSGALVNWLAVGCGGAAGISAGATKFKMVCGLPASCTVKSAFFRSRTGAPPPLLTLTVSRTLSCAIAGSTDNAPIAKRSRIARIFMRTNPPECSQKSGRVTRKKGNDRRTTSDLPDVRPAMIAGAVYASVSGGTMTKLTRRGLPELEQFQSCCIRYWVEHTFQACIPRPVSYTHLTLPTHREV